MPASFAYASEVPPEIQQIPMMSEDESLIESIVVECLFGLGEKGFVIKGLNQGAFQKGFNQNLRKSLLLSNRLSGTLHHESREAIVKPMNESESSAECLFVSTGTQGVVDLGASQTVIGSAQVPELLKQLPSEVSSQIRRVSCNLVFRFGNQQTLASHHAMMIPLQDQWFRIAVVPGKTPFLLSSSFLRYTLQAIIDTEQNTLYSKRLQRHIPLEVTSKNLYLMNLNHLWENDDTVSKQGEEIHPIHMTSTDSARSDLPVQNTVPVQVSHEHDRSGYSRPSAISETKINMVGNRIVSRDASARKDSDQRSLSIPEVVDQDRSCTQQVPSQSRVCDHVVCNAASPAVPSSAEGVTRRDHSPGGTTYDTGGTISREDSIREGTCGNTIPGDVPEQQLHGLVCGIVPQVSQAGSHEVCTLCGTAPRQGDGNWFIDESRTLSQGKGSSEPTDSGASAKGSQGVDRALGSSCTSGRDRRGVRDVTTSAISAHGRASELHARGEQESQPAHEQDGEQCRGDLAAPPSNECQAGAMRGNDDAMFAQDLDWDFDFTVKQRTETFQRRCARMIRQMTQELRNVSQELENTRYHVNRTRADLVEVMCHDQSELVAQCSRLGGVAFRFGLREGDLSTKEGREELFRLLCIRQPTHVWYSPKCGPWSMWSNFNMNRSKSGESKVLQQREESLWQISLAVVLFRFQQVRENQFHMEQPQGSAMWKVPTMEEILTQTERCVFDLCRVGNLKDPPRVRNANSKETHDLHDVGADDSRAGWKEVSWRSCPSTNTGKYAVEWEDYPKIYF